MTLTSLNPATGDAIQTYHTQDSGEIRKIIEDAHSAWLSWSALSMEQRGRPMHELAAVLRQTILDHAALISLEMGKPLREARSEILKCAYICDVFADSAGDMLRDELVDTGPRKTLVAFEPLGVVLGIMPWNFPFWQVFRFAVPTLMAGNACLIKHASNVTGCALIIEDLFRRSGFPHGLLQVLLLSAMRVDEAVAHPLVRGVSLTGSDAAGRAVAASAGRHLKKCVLELGGSDPFLVLADADLETCVQAAATSRMAVSGQVCIAPKRFIVHQSLADAFASSLAERVQTLVVGDPLDEVTDLGPLARADLVQVLDDQVRRSVQTGARILCGGSPVPGPGFFYPPTVLSGVTPSMAVFQEETFGPVAAVISARDTDHALTLANATRFGLGASVWTRDLVQGEALARRIQAGNVFINGLVRSDPRLPFGGIKDSGFGRELSSFGIREFVNVKTIWVDTALPHPHATPLD